MRAFFKVLGLITVIGLVAITSITWASQSTGQVITVCPSGPPACQFSKIQEALDAATDGATILIWPGMYIEREELKISKNVNLLGSEPQLVRLITDRVSVKGLVQVMISGLAIQGLLSYGTLRVYGAKVILANVNIMGSVFVNYNETDTEQPQPSQLTLIRVQILGSQTHTALFIGPDTEAIVSESELVSYERGDGVFVGGARLIMSHSLIKSTHVYGEGLLASRGAKVWLSDTQIEISAPIVPGSEREGPAGIVAYEDSDLVLQRIKIFSTSHGILVKNARLHIEASQIVAITGWGVSLVIEPCGVRLPPIVDPSPQTFEGLVTGRQNEISGAREVGDVCPSELEFLKTPEGGQYP